MSAYIVEPLTIRAIALFAALDRNGNRDECQTEYAKTLFAQNARSVAHRYKETPQEWDDRYDPSKSYPGAVSLLDLHGFPEIVLAAAQGYDYQACETDDYWDSHAASIVRTAASKASRMLCSRIGFECWTIDDHNFRKWNNERLAKARAALSSAK